MRLLHCDIESAPAAVYAWSLFPKFIPIGQVIHPVQMLSVAAKFHGEKKTHFASVHHDGREGMLQKTRDLLDQADAICTWNGLGYDAGHINRELLLAGLTPPSPYKHIDLMRVVKKQFKFQSNKLQYVSTQLGLKGKVSHEGFDLWVKVMDGDPKAWAKFKRYNVQDVVLLEELYDLLLPWITNHPAVQLFSGGDPSGISCTRCGSTEYQSRGTQVALTGVYARYQCTSCGGWFRGTKRTASTDVTAV